MSDLIETASEVRDALAAGRAVVALESTIVTHGMPHPQNVETARAVEEVVRAEGAVPATVAIIDGVLRVGFDAAELDRLGAAKNVVKASSRDLAACMTRKLSAGTTVAATMAIAARAGIPIFATGGIGGVHRGAEETFDISADLTELSRSPVAVVCAGCKSILDIGRTLEMLETLGVPVVGYGTDAFPAFFSRDSGHRVEQRFDTPRDLAALIQAERRLARGTGLLIANPIPEAHALPAAEMEARIEAAVKEAKQAGVARKDVTPWLLARINDLTGGRSLAANIALIRSNAALAAKIAVELAALSRKA